MTTFIVTRKHTYTVANEVYFYYSLLDALENKQRLEEESDVEWLIAEEMDLSGWFGQFIKWLKRKFQ